MQSSQEGSSQLRAGEEATVLSARSVTSPIKKKTAEHLAWNASSVECAAAIDSPPLQFLSNFKRPEDPLNFVGIKNSFGSLQTNSKADDWWVPPFLFLKKCFLETP